MKDQQLAGKVALVTGAARGQGRAVSLRLAAEGAAIIAVDICDQVPSVPYPMATEADLAETVRLIEAAGGSVVAERADVRNQHELDAAVAGGVERFGRLDIVSAGAGICSGGPGTLNIDDQAWQDVLDIDLTGVWRTCKTAVPHIVASGGGGSLVLTSSIAGMKGLPNTGAYAAAKHGVVALTRTLAMELGSQRIRVNCVLPTTVDTPMAMNDAAFQIFAPDVASPGREDMARASYGLHLLEIPWVEVDDVAEAVAFLASDRARYVTGVCLPVDGGLLAR